MRKYLKHNNERGFSIIEMTIYMGILAILLGILSTLFASTISAQLEAESTTSVDQTGRQILLRLTNDIHSADSITSPALGATSNSLTIVSGSNSYTYTVDANNNLTITDPTGTYVLNDSDTQISNVSFTRMGDLSTHKNTIMIQYTVTSKIQRNTGFETKTYDTTIGIR